MSNYSPINQPQTPMNNLWISLPNFIRTTSWRATTCVSLCLTPIAGAFVVGCADAQNAKHTLHQTQAQQTQSFKPLTGFYAPNEAAIQGQKNALLHFMSQKWQLKSINHIPVGHPVVLDLREFAKGRGFAFTDCDEIFFEFDTQKILGGSLSVVNIERKIGECAHNMGDDIMRILGDLHSFHHQNGVLTFISLKDKIELVPTK